MLHRYFEKRLFGEVHYLALDDGDLNVKLDRKRAEKSSFPLQMCHET